MANYLFSEIAAMLHAGSYRSSGDPRVDSLLTDSRKLLFPETTLFFAISSEYKDAHQYIPDLYSKGVRCFVVEKGYAPAADEMPDANIIHTDDVLRALQRLAATHRQRFRLPVVGITGSNGKTIVKEWLYHLLSDRFNPVQSPKSYNSQAGVPLSIWHLEEAHDVALFEAGISREGEMGRLREMIDPSVGIITCIGEAHAKGFPSRAGKIREKLELFSKSRVLIFGNDDPELEKEVLEFRNSRNPELEIVTWGRGESDFRMERVEKLSQKSRITLAFESKTYSFIIPFTDDASVSNAISCFVCMVQLGGQPDDFMPAMEHLRPVEMRLELKKGINNCTIINDSYSADLNSLSVALDFLDQQKQHPKKTLILSDMLESGKKPGELYSMVAAILAKRNLYRFIGIGSRISGQMEMFSGLKHVLFYENTDDFLDRVPEMGFLDEAILLKGARVFRFEKISHALQQKSHETVLEINLHAMRHNLKVYRGFLKPGTGIMAMVKAFSYGSGSFEVANLLQHAGISYLAVAYADEGSELRHAGISLPIMVMNPEGGSFDQLIKNKLEPELYSLFLLKSFISHLQYRNIRHYPVHIKLDTGMHRLGFMQHDMNELCDILSGAEEIKVCSVFSHLAGSSDPEHDDFTRTQSEKFNSMSAMIRQAIKYDFLRHLANSGAIHRHPESQYDMVRLGIGLYGIDSDAVVQQQLQTVATLKTTISQIKKVPAGQSIGYSRRAVAEKDMMIAVVRIGYADGYPRSLSNGAARMLVNNMPAPVVGNVCMDMTMLDVTGLDAAEGDEVVVFGEFLPVDRLAEWAGTITYEILTGISQRVRRIYFEE